MLSIKVSNVEESTTLAITALVKKLKSEGNDVLSFSAGEPDFPTPKLIKDAAIEAINSNFTKYTANEGTPDLLKAIVRKFKEENGLEYKTSEILVSNGAKQSIFNILLSLCNPGDEVIYQAPYWVSYPEIIKLAGAESVMIQAKATENYKITPGQLAEAISDKTKAIIFNSPSNPTGAVYTETEIRALMEVIKDTEIFVISDEIYEKIVYDELKHFSPARIDFLKERCFTVNGVSKAFAMTGWRIGFVAGNEEVIKLARNLQSHSTSNACSISQAATTAGLLGLLDGDELQSEMCTMITAFNRRRDLIYDNLSHLPGIILPKPHGAFYAFFDVSSFYGKSYNGYEVKDSTTMCKYLLKEGLIGLVPGSAFGDDHCVRMSYACSYETIEDGLERLKSTLMKLK